MDCYKIGNKLTTFVKNNPNTWLSKLYDNAEKATVWIGEHQITFKKLAENNSGLKQFASLDDILAPKSVYEATKSAIAELETKQTIIRDMIKELPADNNPNFIKLDKKGNIITKNELQKKDGNCIIKLKEGCDPELRMKFEEYGVSELIVKNGDIQQATISVYKFKPQNGITSNRTQNMKNYYEQLANEWGENPSLIPETIRNQLSESQVKNLSPDLVQTALSKAQITPHEAIDGYVYLVDSYIHGKVSHYGAVALASALEKLEISSQYFKQLSCTTVYAISGTLIAKGAA